MNLDGIAALVTGGASGLGAAVATRLSCNGAQVTLFDRDSGKGTEHAIAIGGRFEEVDITNEAAVSEAIMRAEDAHGVARIVANCAGVAPASRMIDRDGKPRPIADFARAVAINLTGTYTVMMLTAARMLAAEAIGEERGVVINTASIAAFEGQIGQTAYAASKGGVAALTLPAARELARDRIRVVAIAPGLFLTPMLQGLPHAARDALGSQVPHPSRLGDPAEFAALVQSIISNPMLNGSVLRLDGALRMPPK